MYTDDERMFAMVAHGGILLGPLTGGLGGIIAAFIIWLVKRDESEFIRFQSFQALVYQTVGAVALWALFGLSVLLVMVAIGCLFLPLTMLLAIAFVVYGVYGAYVVYQGRDFRYFLLGDLLAERR